MLAHAGDYIGELLIFLVPLAIVVGILAFRKNEAGEEKEEERDQ
jgi:hypothetical protein